MPISDAPWVAVTGSAGRLGRPVVQALQKGGYRVRGLDRLPTPFAEESIIADLSDTIALDRLTSGVSSLIHLAATPDDSTDPSWFEQELIPTNILGLRNVLRAAGATHVPRLILASSGQVNWHQQYNGPLPVRATDPISPRSWYAASKVWMESAGYSHAQAYRNVVIAVRLGWCPRKGQAAEIAENPTAQDLYLSPNDAGRFFLGCVQADVPVGFHILYASSLPVKSPVFDIQTASRLLNWQPEDRWPHGAEEF
jgi:nucleoside-diphosphate-sugar epimerase